MKQKIITVVIKKSIFCLNLNLMMFSSVHFMCTFLYLLYGTWKGET